MKRWTDCISLSLPLYSLPIAGRWKLHTVRNQAKLQGAWRGFGPKMCSTHGPLVCGYVLAPINKNPQLWANSCTALYVPWDRKRLREQAPTENPGVEPLRQLDAVLCHLLAAPAAALAPNCICSPFPLVSTSNAKREVLTSGHPKICSHSTQSCSTLQWSLQWCHKTSAQHRKWQLLVISSLSNW